MTTPCIFPWIADINHPKHYVHTCVLPQGHDDEHQCFCDQREIW